MSELRHRACAAHRAAATQLTCPLRGALPAAGQQPCQHQRLATAIAVCRGATPGEEASVSSAISDALCRAFGATASAAQSTLADLVAGHYLGISPSAAAEVGRERLEAFSESLWLEYLEEGGPTGAGSPSVQLSDADHSGTFSSGAALGASGFGAALRIVLDAVLGGTPQPGLVSRSGF